MRVRCRLFGSCFARAHCIASQRIASSLLAWLEERSEDEGGVGEWEVCSRSVRGDTKETSIGWEVRENFQNERKPSIFMHGRLA